MKPKRITAEDIRLSDKFKEFISVMDYMEKLKDVSIRVELSELAGEIDDKMNGKK